MIYNLMCGTFLDLGENLEGLQILWTLVLHPSPGTLIFYPLLEDVFGTGWILKGVK